MDSKQDADELILSRIAHTALTWISRLSPPMMSFLDSLAFAATEVFKPHPGCCDLRWISAWPIEHGY